MKHWTILRLPTILIAFCVILISSACSNSGNKKAENTAPVAIVADSTTVGSIGTENPIASAAGAQEAMPSAATVPQADKNKRPETPQTAKREASEVNTTTEQPKTNPSIPPKQEAKEAIPTSPPPAPTPVMVEKPKEVVVPPPPTAKPSTQTPQPDPGKWVVPSKDKDKKNPVKADAESLSLGKSLYIKHCASCHGKKGHGDGSKAAQLDTKCGDFTLAAFKSQTDGALFYKIMEGRDDMPSYKKKLPDAVDIWSIVNYIKTL